MRESDLLAHIYDRSRALRERDPSILVGPGDDCAVVRTAGTGAGAGGGGTLLLTVDHLVEGRHFAPGTPIDLVARKAIARSLSDIAAMAGVPRWGLATGLLPAGYPHGDELFDAMSRWALHWNCPLVGGDIATWDRQSDALVALTVSVIGECRDHPPVLRSGAKPGDTLYVTGTVGGSLAADGLGKHLTFEPRLAEARELAERLGPALHAMMDVSDGLGIDAGRLGAASGVRCELLADQLPLTPGVGGAVRAVADGEDYELLFAADPAAPIPLHVAGTPVTRIGRVLAGTGCVLVESGGRATDISGAGWEHR